MPTKPALPAYETLVTSIDSDGICTIQLNRPQASNAINTKMMEELGDLFRRFYYEHDLARCLILTGTGTKVFCAGADLKERHGMTEPVWFRQHALLQQAIRAIMACPVPMIAAVNGAAFAGGLELVLASDFAYGVETSRFALTEVTLGIMPGAGGTQHLARTVGSRRAKELILTGQPFSAADALSWGILNKIVPADQLMSEVRATALRIASNAPISVRQAKRAIDASGDLDRASGYTFEIEAYNRTVMTEDRREGITAFNEKRKPVFKGR